MSTEEQPAPTPGSVPNSFGNALAWKWTRQMPTAVRRSGLPTLLYALRAMANAAGELRFGDRKAIRIQDIAKAACANEKDTRRYLDAAIRAGVVGVKGERRRGTSTVYCLLLTPFPDWGAAEDHLRSTARKPGKRPAAWQQTESSGDRDPNQFGPPRPELEADEADEVRVTATRTSSGDRDPNGSGDRDPNNPGVTQEGSQDGAGSVCKPKLVGAPEPQPPDPHSHEEHHNAQPPADEPTDGDFIRCARCQRPMIPRHGRTTHPNCPPVTADHRSAS
ncbi:MULTISPECIES: hypothetical protein [unclassified Streptomyces]|uniref:hypothetical protein n=1 Tax=unclassified Streptomyces TaxID=2593676 RepID=UPI003BB6A215